MEPIDDSGSPAEGTLQERKSFGRLVTPHLPRLIAYAWALLGDYHAAQDVVQEALLVASRKLPQAPPAETFRAWLMGVVRFQALNARRKRERRETVIEEAIDRLYGMTSSAARPGQVEALAECVQSLVGRMAEILRAHYFANTSLSDIAGGLGMSLASVKQILYRGRLALKGCVEKRLASEQVSR